MITRFRYVLKHREKKSALVARSRSLFCSHAMLLRICIDIQGIGRERTRTRERGTRRDRRGRKENGDETAHG
jgi:hypothetical protein